MIQRLRKTERGQVALEMICVMFVWLLCTSMFFNLLFYLGSTMLIDSTLNKAATQIGAFGCVPERTEFYSANIRGLGATNVNVAAKQINNEASASVRDETYYTNSGGKIESFATDANGVLKGQLISNCTSSFQRDTVPHGRYIWVQMRYTQNLWLFGVHDVHRDVLVVSSGLTQR